MKMVQELAKTRHLVSASLDPFLHGAMITKDGAQIMYFRPVDDNQTISIRVILAVNQLPIFHEVDP